MEEGKGNKLFIYLLQKKKKFKSLLEKLVKYILFKIGKS